MFVPPAMNMPRADSSIAIFSSAAAMYPKGSISRSLPGRGNGRDDVGIRAAPADVAAHQLAHLGIRLREALDRRHLLALRHHRELHAALDAAAIDMHGARAALAVVAAFLRAG